MSVVHESQNYIRHCWLVVHIKVICKFKVWFPAHMDRVQRWVVDIHPDFIQLFHTFITRNHCHSHRFCIQLIIHMHNIMDIICYQFQRAMNFTKTFIRYVRSWLLSKALFESKFHCFFFFSILSVKCDCTKCISTSNAITTAAKTHFWIDDGAE